MGWSEERKQRERAKWTPERRAEHGRIIREAMRYWKAYDAALRKQWNAEDEARQNGWLFVSDTYGVPWHVRPNKDWLEIYPWNRWMVDEQAAREKAGW